MRHLLTAALACALIVATAASAQTSRRSSSGDVGGARDAVVCRRFVRTGSLADFYRVCKTRAEWDRERQNIRDGVMNRNSCQTETVGGHTPGGYGGQVPCGI